MSNKIISGLLTMFSIAFFSLAINPSEHKKDDNSSSFYRGDGCTIGEITLFAGNRAPLGWKFCAGQLISTRQNDALFSIIGTSYGGDGRTTFALPDFRGRAVIGGGTGPGITKKPIGEKDGRAIKHLTSKNLPLASSIADLPVFEIQPGAKSTDLISGNKSILASANTTATNISGHVQTTPQGYNRGYDTTSPSLSVNYMICFFGDYPSNN